MRRIIHLIIALTCACIIMCGYAAAETSGDIVTGSYGENIVWILDRTIGTLTVSGTGPIPDAPDYGETPWDEYKDDIRTVVIEEGITRIGDYAFWSFENMSAISLCQGIQEIGFCSIMYCPSLSELVFQEGLTSIADWSCAKCESLTSVTLPASVTFIDEYAFFKCHLLTGINYYGTPEQWEAIDIVEVPDEDKPDDPLVSATVYFVSAVTDSGTCGEGVSWELDYTCTLTISGNGAMDDGADFGDTPWDGYKDQIRSIIVENGVTHIGAYAFWNCENVRTVYLGNSLKSIGKAAFMYCSGVAQLRLPDGFETIGDWAFVHCHGLEWIYVPASVTSIGQWSMEECSCALLYGGTEQQWESIDIHPENDGLSALTVMYEYTISACNHRYDSEVVTEPTCYATGVMRYTCRLCDEYTEGHTYTAVIPTTRHHFANGSCTNLLADGVTPCGASITSTSNYIYFTQPRDGLHLDSPGSVSVRLLYTSNGVFLGGSDAELRARYRTYFAVTKLNPDGSVGEVIDAQTYSTGYLDFVNDFALTTVTLPSNGTYIFNVSTANGMDDPDRVTVTVGEPEVYENSGDIGDLYWELEDGVLTISGNGEMCDFDSVTPWDRREIREIVIEEGVTTIGNGAFHECHELTRVSLPSSLTAIGAEAFLDCEQLSDFTIPQNVTFVGDFAFGHCESLTEMKVPMAGIAQFKGCEHLEKVTVTGGVEIGMSAFLECRALREISLPDGIVRIDLSAFEGCVDLETIVIPATVAEIGAYAFNECGNLTSIEFSSGVESVEEYAFSGSGLEEVVYHGSAQDWRNMDIGEGNDELTCAARQYDTLTADFVLPASLTEIESEAFAGIPDVVIRVPAGTRIADDAFDPSVVFTD